ncbi:Flp pilus assembly pilin Flp [Brevibacterium pityocampae]
MSPLTSACRRALASARERGAATIEYAGIAVVITIIIAGLVAIPWNSMLSSGLGTTVCKIFSQTASGPAEFDDAAPSTDDPVLLAAGTDLTAALPITGGDSATSTAVAADCSSTDDSANGSPGGPGGQDGTDHLPIMPGDDGADSGQDGSEAGDPGSGTPESGSDSGSQNGSDDTSSENQDPADGDRPHRLPGDAVPTEHSVMGYDGPFYIDDAGQIYDGDGFQIPNTRPDRRPSYAPGQVEKVWEQSREQQIEDYENGNLWDESTPPEKPSHPPAEDSMWVLDKNGKWREITWKPGDSRQGVWDMGHLPGEEYRKLHEEYINGKITREDFLEKYRDPDNYQVEDPGRNRSHKDEKP